MAENKIRLDVALVERGLIESVLKPVRLSWRGKSMSTTKKQ